MSVISNNLASQTGSYNRCFTNDGYTYGQEVVRCEGLDTTELYLK